MTFFRKIFSLWCQLFKTNPYLSSLRTMNRVFSLTLFWVMIALQQAFHFSWSFEVMLFYPFMLIVLLDVFFFDVLRLQESEFKDHRVFFKKNRFSSQRIDHHARITSRVRLLLVSLVFMLELAGHLNFTVWLIVAALASSAGSALAYSYTVAFKHPVMKKIHVWVRKNIHHLESSKSDFKTFPTDVGGYCMNGYSASEFNKIDSRVP